MRELTRHRSSLAAKRAQASNEMQKALESANIKLQSVVSDITGVSATEMLAEMLSGNTDAKELAQLAKYRLLPWLLNFQLNALRLRLVTRLSKKNLYGPIIPVFR